MTWRKDALCLNEDTGIFYQAFDKDDDSYDHELAKYNDSLCAICPVRTRCFAEAVSNHEWGIWAGIYFDEGNVSEVYNAHKTREDWANTWSSITMEREKL